MADRLFHPIAAGAPRPLRFEFDGAEITARPHDTVLAAVLAAQASCGASEFDGGARAGFCLMGSCQECTMWDEAGHRLRGCMTEAKDGLRLRSRPFDGAV
ncbi:MAG: NAD(FAD)-dependent dehydrogenase [Rhodobacteraceae bacterium]|uniref:2Fe-2S iron-sulfur cluster binding domain-containing protein n=1 Tax=Salipiger profundus TaxID=1229727 RepID=A0A1U7DCF7_9RHOB|nr:MULTISPECIES: 2Fe-2S iron-sulfur cluster-binding protein [Salipiger]APX25756.1 2Fe-2S iron-sulfur cluster binding domain-containing protein [Salipiger profundus]MAB08518.1 NAD(FAD)-dependent dehydrogenase [Paracoccaceae bacterium]SFC84313.1 2Fe-2S iron-sulfur cluster binding domain-containing protein [Salipiger profundus]